MFSICESMKWAHLPEAGGLYAQDPELLDGFQIIFHERTVWEDEERKKEELERNKQTRSPTRSRASRPHR